MGFLDKIRGKTDDYFKTNFKYSEGLYAREFIELINKSNTPKTSNSPKMINKTKDKPTNFSNANLISCPNCHEKIPANAIRCKYCKTMLKTY